MILKKIYSENKKKVNNLSHEKKVLSKHVYNKFIARSDLLGSSSFNILDNNSTFYNISSEDIEKIIKISLQDLKSELTVKKKKELKNLIDNNI